MKTREILLHCAMLTLPYVQGGLLALMLVQAARLGASPAVSGYYVALCFLTLAIGTALAPKLWTRIPHWRALVLCIGVLKVPLLFLVGQANTVIELMLFGSLDWLLGGIVIVMVNTSAALRAPPAQRAQVFGIMALSASLGELIGSTLCNLVLRNNGFDVLMFVFAATGMLLPLFAFATAKLAHPGAGPAKGTTRDRGSFGLPLLAFFGIATVGRLAAFGGLAGATAAMSNLGFLPAAISTLGIAGSIAGIITALALSRFGDHIPKRRLLAGVYGLCAAGYALLAVSSEQWQFALGSAPRNMLITCSTVISQTLLTQWLPRERLNSAMAMWLNTSWVGAIASFALAGNLIGLIGPSAFLAVAAAVLAAVMLAMGAVLRTRALNPQVV